MNYQLESISIHHLVTEHLREEAIQDVLSDTDWRPEAYRIIVEDGQVLEAVHYTALNLVVFDHDTYDVDGNLDAVIRQAIAATEPDAWSLEK